MTDLHAAAGEYLAIRRALGFKLRGHDRLLAEFIAFLTDTGSPTVTTTAALTWATRSPHLQSVRYAQRLSVVRGFAGYLHALDAAVEVPPLDLLSYRRQRRTPTSTRTPRSTHCSLRPICCARRFARRPTVACSGCLR